MSCFDLLHGSDQTGVSKGLCLSTNIVFLKQNVLQQGMKAMEAKMAASFNKAHLRKITEKSQLSPYGILDLLNTQKCLKDFFVQRGLFGDHLNISEVNQNMTLSLMDKERDDKINNIIKSIVEKSIADIAKLRQLIALWDAEERSTTNVYIDESSYGVITQHKIKQYLKNFFSERLMSAENPKEFLPEGKEGYLMSSKEREHPDSNMLEYGNEEPKGDDSSPMLGKAISMISHVIQPVVDTIEVTKAMAKKVRSAWKDEDITDNSDKEAEEESEIVEGGPVSSLLPTSEDPEVKVPSASHSSSLSDKEISREEEHQNFPVISTEGPAEESSSANLIMSTRIDSKYFPLDILDEGAAEELCRFEKQLTPRLSPILEETGEANSSASSSANTSRYAGVARSGPCPCPITSALQKANVFKNEIPLHEYETAENPCALEVKSSPRLSTSSLNVMDEKLPDASEEEARKDSWISESGSTSGLDDTGVADSPVPSPSTSSPIIEKAKNIISHVIQPVVHTIDSASKVTKTAGKTIVKKMKSIWKSRSGKKKGKKAKVKNETKAEKDFHHGSLDEEEEEEDEEESFSGISGALEDAELGGSAEDPSSIVEETNPITSDSKVEKPQNISEQVAVEKFCFFEEESCSGLSTLLETATSKSHSTTPTSFPLEKANMIKNTRSYEQPTPNISNEKTEEEMSCHSIGLASIPDSKLGATETDEEQASGLNLLQSEGDANEHNIYSIFENIFRQEFSKKLENSLRQGLCDAVRVYVPERSSVESLESVAMTGKPICSDIKQSKDEFDGYSTGPRDSPYTGSTSIASSSSYQLIKGSGSKNQLSDDTLKEDMQPEGLHSKRKSLWKRWKMRRSRKIRPNNLEVGCCPGTTLDTVSDSQATKPAIKSIFKKVKSIWK
ncbi:uncharacterized protein [Nerophis lumbriciformis]|uniref:uncharacterized protein n=1 Tax=Nerophis lumbriciformis TaxID=546530 RepID=UPI003BABC408